MLTLFITKKISNENCPPGSVVQCLPNSVLCFSISFFKNGGKRQHNCLSRNSFLCSYLHRRPTAEKLNGIVLGVEFIWYVAIRGIRSLSKESLIFKKKTPLRRHYSLSDSLTKRRSLVAGLTRNPTDVYGFFGGESLLLKNESYDNITKIGRFLPKRQRSRAVGLKICPSFGIYL